MDPAQQTLHLGTERLQLEPLRIFHAAEMVSVLGDRTLYEFTGGEPPTFEQLTRRYTMQFAGSRHETEQWHNWILRLRGPNCCVGFVQATVTLAGAQIAWTVGSPWQGRGLAKEAAMAMCAWLTDHGVKDFEAAIHPDHAASHGIARHVRLSATQIFDDDGEQLWQSPSRP